MKRALFAAVGLGIGVATACTTPPGAPITCATATYNEKIGFDITHVGSTLKGTYHHLTFQGLTVKDINKGNHTRGLIPHSEPHYALSNRGTDGGDYVTTTLSIDGTATTTFDMNSLWFGCLSPHNTESGYAAVECQVSIDCVAPLSMEGHLGPELFTFTPSGPEDQQMIKMDVGYTYCTEVTMGVSEGGAFDGSGDAILVVDSLNYVAREGEVILEYGGKK